MHERLAFGDQPASDQIGGRTAGGQARGGFREVTLDLLLKTVAARAAPSFAAASCS